MKDNKILYDFKILPFLIIFATLFLGIGYAAMNAITLDIKGTIGGMAQDGIFISDVIADESSTISYSGTLLHCVFDLQNPESNPTKTYQITVYNNGTETKHYFDATYGENFYSNPNIVYKVTGITQRFSLEPGASKTFSITFKYNEGVTEGNTNLDAYINFEFGKSVTFPYLPTGFSEVDGTSLDTGLVIQDGNGNQYVWVEVPKTEEVYSTAGLSVTEFSDEEYASIENDLHTYTETYRNGTSYDDSYDTDGASYVEAATGLTSTQYAKLKKKMLKSVYLNGGFYVGRYETGIADDNDTSTTEWRTAKGEAITQTPVIQANAYPYNYVTNAQAQSLASSFSPQGEEPEYTTSLMFGVQWDLILKYIETKEKDTNANIIYSLKTNSSYWGNYIDNEYTTYAQAKYSTDFGNTWTSGIFNKTTGNSILVTTGACSKFSKQNIFDIAGNLHEWTLEYTQNANYPGVFRGGNFAQTGVTSSSKRDANSTIASNYWHGFRITLY